MRQWLIEFKKTASCVRCGFSHPAAIQFHHWDAATKKFDISSAPTLEKSIPQVLEEMKKCEVICANCHLIHHYEERQQLAADQQYEEAEYQELIEDEFDE